jgi:hypothetical protein
MGGAVESKSEHKTKAIIEIFLWHIAKQGYANYKCEEIIAFTEIVKSENLEKDQFETLVNYPFELFESDGKTSLNDLQIIALLFSSDDNGMRINLFKQLTDDPEKLIYFLRKKYGLIYSIIPRYLIGQKLIDEEIGTRFIKKKQHKIFDRANFMYNQYTTSSCNVVKLSMLKV